MANIPSTRRPRLADYSADYRMLILAAMAIVAGTGGAFGAWVLLKLIAFATNLFWYGRPSVAPAVIAGRSWWLVLAVPVVGGLIVGLMARFGSDKIRGHGIPEAIETILFGDSKLSLKVALLKPLSSAVSIGSGGPFGAEGPIIMTGGAIGSLFAQLFRSQRRRAQDPARRRRDRRHDRHFRNAVRGDHARGRAAAVRMEAAQLRAGRDRRPGRAGVASAADRGRAAVPVRRADSAGNRAGRDRRRARACHRPPRCPPVRCFSTGSRTGSTPCRSTGCGGRRSAPSSSGSAACSTCACSAPAMAASRRCSTAASPSKPCCCSSSSRPSCGWSRWVRGRRAESSRPC